MDETFQGYTNWPTWNLNLCINHDEYSYLKRKEMGEKLMGWSAESVKWFCWDLYPGGTPNMKDGEMEEVNYQELAQQWNAERVAGEFS